MTTINELSTADTVAAGDGVPVFSVANGDTRRAPMSVLADYMQGALSFPQPLLVTQYASPSATAFTVTVAQSDDTWLVLTPTGGFAAGTVRMSAAPVDQQLVTVFCSQAVTTLTVNGNGFSVIGAPTTLAANGFFSMRYDAINTIWRRVG